MKKTVFEGIVNGTKYNNVNDYNEAVKTAIDSGENVKASSKTEIVEVSNNENVGFSVDDLVSKEQKELETALNQLSDSFVNLPTDQKENVYCAVKDAKTYVENCMDSLAKDVDRLDTQATEIQDHIDKLNEKYNKVTAEADSLNEKYDKLSMISDCFDDIAEAYLNEYTKNVEDGDENNQPIPSEPSLSDCFDNITDLWNKLFGA